MGIIERLDAERADDDYDPLFAMSNDTLVAEMRTLADEMLGDPDEVEAVRERLLAVAREVADRLRAHE